MPEAAGEEGQSGADDGTATAEEGAKRTHGNGGTEQDKKSALKRILKGDSGAARTRDPQLRRLLLYPTELRNRSDTAKLAQLFRICNTSDRVSATDRGTSIRRPVLLPYPLSNCARPHNEKAPQRPSSASSDRPSSHKESRPHYPPESSSPFGRKAVLRSEQRETQKESLLPHRSR